VLGKMSRTSKWTPRSAIAGLPSVRTGAGSGRTAPGVRITIAKIEYHRFTMGTNHLPMNARAMRVFAEVVASGSFSVAARRLRRSKPSRMEESQ